MEDTFNSFDTTIRGTYTQILNYRNNDFSNNFYKSDLHQIIEEHIEEKNKIQNQILDIQLDNTRLLQHIFFLDKRCCLINITHSNTTNFILANYSQLKTILDRLIIIYNKNLEYINYFKEKIYSIDLSITTLKLNYHHLNN